ncbi:cytochrome b/b6 domain-containing protein [Altererythrobacter sp. ZODW24]|uniref:cytochrome b/b6 domain-containing protein n=1 Tax=Altererythrobacter sp. ZODW24 TaxID=2185142 RepID=UPI000DF8297A|nr:cytochrome b/b6 domain-containing protein [Altererythrobacter sp. ZODW24]
MKRHLLSSRLWHWINAISLIILFMSGLNISNAHPRLYWGHYGFAPEDAWLHVMRFPGWMTIPDYYSLARAREWHLLFAWPFAIALLFFLIAALVNGHAKRDLTTRKRDWNWSAIKEDIAQHLKLNFEHGSEKYNFLQRLSYGLVIFIGLPLMIFTGLAMSPAMDANWPWIVDVFGGRQSARSIHFIVAFGLAAFFVLHIVLVVLAGPIVQLRDMITGGALEEESPAPKTAPEGDTA